MTLNELMQRPQYSVPHEEKQAALFAELQNLCRRHEERSPEYARIAQVLFPDRLSSKDLAGLPYLPVALFKERLLSSVPEAQIFKILRSSGTTSQTPSRVVLDSETAQLQTMALGRIMSHVLGTKRLPMILVESADLIKDRREFNARAAGILGMMTFGRDHLYALDNNLNLRVDDLKQFLHRFGNSPFLIFGFTFLVWSRFYQGLRSVELDLSQGILIHSGGWKKLEEKAVSPAEFKAAFMAASGLRRIYNFYGMVEQVGSVFVEGEDGYLYPPNFADVIVRDPLTFEELPTGQPGIIEVLSLLPRSYPGQCLLTEDIGIVHGIDSSSDGRFGKAFSVLGRIPRAELRGCSDVIAASEGPRE
jgi:hypothetical protein